MIGRALALSSVARRWATLPRLEPIPPQQTTLKIEITVKSPSIPYPYTGPSVQKRDPSNCPTWRPSPSPRLPPTSTLPTTLLVPFTGDPRPRLPSPFPPSHPPQTAPITSTPPTPVPPSFRPPLRCQMSWYNSRPAPTFPSFPPPSVTGQPQMPPLNLLLVPLSPPISSQSGTLNRPPSPTPRSSHSSPR
jgi:hypothetical protein